MDGTLGVAEDHTIWHIAWVEKQVLEDFFWTPIGHFALAGRGIFPC